VSTSTFRLGIGPARSFLPNRWDLVAFPLIIGGLILASHGAHETLAPLPTVNEPVVSLSPWNLPEYAVRTTLRMLAALAASLVFTFIYGTLAAKSRRWQRVLIPILDILQSVPVLGYISFTVVFFMALFPGRVAGAECAAIFAIFTAQAWNMTFSFYQSLRTVPHDLEEASRSFRFSAWQRFWTLEVPFAMPGLIWNMMMSMSGSWFFIVASEAITVGDKTITLPGVGAYLAEAITEKNLAAVGWVILAMTAVIVLYDQFLFRPMVAWAEKFRFEQTASQVVAESWFLKVIERTRLIQQLLRPVHRGVAFLLDLRLPVPGFAGPSIYSERKPSAIADGISFAVVTAIAVYALWHIVSFIATELGWSEVGRVFILGVVTLIRVLVVIVLASLIWVPLGVMIGLRPRLAEKIQPLAQFLAAFPANLLFPIFVIGIVHFHGNTDIWLTPLMMLGTQWYILFNVIAGATAYPTDFREAAANFGIRGWQWWQTVILPGIFPYFVTGAITASGGAWNASIVSEAASWGDTKLSAHGLGAYIAQTTAAGDYPKIVLGIVVMSLFVVIFNRLLWRPLYRYAENHLRLD
jgi:NitT/TauT family transport system permease protein